MAEWGHSMVMHRAALDEWMVLLQQVRGELEETRTRLAEAEADVARQEHDVEAIEDSIRVYQERHRLPVAYEPMVADAQQNGRTLTARRREFLRDYARQRRGRLILREARDGLIQLGLFRNVIQFRQQIGRLMADMDCWERIRGRRGHYRLVMRNGQHP